MVPNIKQAYWVSLTYLACHGVRKTSNLKTVFVNLENHRENEYWLWHDLLDILDLIVTDCQDWIDDVSWKEENMCYKS